MAEDSSEGVVIMVGVIVEDEVDDGGGKLEVVDLDDGLMVALEALEEVGKS